MHNSSHLIRNFTYYLTTEAHKFSKLEKKI